MANNLTAINTNNDSTTMPALAAAAAASLMKPISLENAFNTFNNTLNETLNSTIANTFNSQQQQTQQQNLVQQYEQQMNNLLNGHQNTFQAGNTYLTQFYNTQTIFNNSLLSMLPNMYTTKDNLFNHHNLPIKQSTNLSFEHLFSNEIKKDFVQNNDLDNLQNDSFRIQSKSVDNNVENDTNNDLQNNIEDCKEHLKVCKNEQKETGEQLKKDKLDDSNRSNGYNKLNEFSRLNESINEEANVDTLKNQYLTNILAQLNGKVDNKSRKRSLDQLECSNDCMDENEQKSFQKNLDQNVITHLNSTKKSKSN